MIRLTTPRGRLVGALLGIAAVTAAAAAANIARARASGLMVDLESAAGQARNGAHMLSTVVERGEPEREVVRLREELAQLDADLRQPALVTAELTSACRATGVRVVGIRPMPRPAVQGQNSSDTADESPLYLLQVLAEYPRLASLMDEFTRRRLPVRVVGYAIDPVEDDSQGTHVLRAEITVEAYRAVRTARQEASP